ncbi:MAG: sigma-70 family RNA polymerase sigma factor [Pirellulales bacterium]|nr:sigma-70 family RNA polymerase sigma factor [Pirellulales bacterium]
MRSPLQAADAHADRHEVRESGSAAVDLDALVAIHGRPLARLVARLVNRPEDVEDIVQETFLAVLSHGQAFRGECRPGTWLARIAVNRCRSHHRRRRLRRWMSFVSGHEHEDGSDNARGESGEEVRRAVARLPGKHREVIVLRYFEELPVDQMAEVLKVSRAAVEKRLSRARQQLKDILGPRLD